MKSRRGYMLAGVALIALLATASDIDWTPASHPNPNGLPADAGIDGCYTEACMAHAAAMYPPPNVGLAALFNR